MSSAVKQLDRVGTPVLGLLGTVHDDNHVLSLDRPNDAEPPAHEKPDEIAGLEHVHALANSTTAPAPVEWGTSPRVGSAAFLHDSGGRAKSKLPPRLLTANPPRLSLGEGA